MNTCQLPLSDAREGNPDLEENYALSQIVEQYGSPTETATAYKEIEAGLQPASQSLQNQRNRKSGLAAFFGIYNDPRAWGGMLYMLISLLLGLVYFDWAIVALSLTLVFILILSIFFRSAATFYLLSIEGLALMEGRIVEASPPYQDAPTPPAPS